MSSIEELKLKKRNKAAMHDPEVRDWLKKGLPHDEGDRDYIHLDPKGIPTMGNGHALGTASKEGHVTMHGERYRKQKLAPSRA